MRRGFLTTGIGLVLLLVGCGGNNGHDFNTTQTGTRAGSLADMLISPAPGSAFISRDTAFTLTWSDGTTPPPEFTVSLERYTEDGDSSSPQKTDLTREGDSYTWDLSRSNNFELDSPGVYYLDIQSGAEEVFATYIVSGERSESIGKAKAAATRANAADPPSGDSAFVHTVTVTTTPK